MTATAVQPTSSEIHKFPPSEVTTHLIPSFIANTEKVLSWFLSVYRICLITTYELCNMFLIPILQATTMQNHEHSTLMPAGDLLQDSKIPTNIWLLKTLPCHLQWEQLHSCWILKHLLTMLCLMSPNSALQCQEQLISLCRFPLIHIRYKLLHLNWFKNCILLKVTSYTI
jgi:hypothetical protein